MNVNWSANSYIGHRMDIQLGTKSKDIGLAIVAMPLPHQYIYFNQGQYLVQLGGYRRPFH